MLKTTRLLIVFLAAVLCFQCEGQIPDGVLTKEELEQCRLFRESKPGWRPNGHKINAILDKFVHAPSQKANLSGTVTAWTTIRRITRQDMVALLGDESPADSGWSTVPWDPKKGVTRSMLTYRLNHGTQLESYLILGFEDGVLSSHSILLYSD